MTPQTYLGTQKSHSQIVHSVIGNSVNLKIKIQQVEKVAIKIKSIKSTYNI